MKLVKQGVAAAVILLIAGFACSGAVQKEVEADWMLAAEAACGSNSGATVETDAAGGCDGVKDGRWGFHTGQQKNPWWQVDLARPQDISRIVLWNRCDGARDRTSRIEALVSNDEKAWRAIYTHDGTAFGGVPDGKPLRLSFTNISARYVRLQLRGDSFLHLDEVEIFSDAAPGKNLALNCPAKQSSISQWSSNHRAKREPNWTELTKQAQAQIATLASERGLKNHSSQVEGTYVSTRRQLREWLFSDPLLDFRDLLFVKRAPGTFSHMSDQYYGWWSRPGGGVCVLKDWKRESAQLVCLTPQFAPGSFLKPELSFDGRHVLFSYCRYHPGVREAADKTRKQDLPEDAFYHVYEMNVDGSAMRQITRGHYDDFNARYLPNGEIIFLSTRRGTFLQTGSCASSTAGESALPDSYVRCGGGSWRPVAVYTLHVMDRDGGSLRAVSPFENFEWDPVLAHDGRVVYARWDYVDRDNMPYMSLWSTNPDGTNPQLVYGNHTRSPYGIFEARPVPNTRKFVFTASAHHSISGGSLCLLNPEMGNEEAAPLTRLTPEVAYPEIEGWSSSWYATPYPLSEKLFITSWSAKPLAHEGQEANATNSLGLYLYHASGARELIYRDPAISCSDPIPVRRRAVPSAVSSTVEWAGREEGRFLLLDVYQGLTGVPRGSVKAIRVVGVPAKVQPEMNTPQLGLTKDDPGKFVLGTAPVGADGSAYFPVPSGINVFFQALDERGLAIQTMRTVSYVQPGQTLSCVGCHEHRGTAPLNHAALAAQKEPSRLTPGPEGSWPYRFDHLVQPVLEAKCVRCHSPASSDKTAARFDLTAARSYEALVAYGKPSLRDQVRKRYFDGRSVANDGTAQSSMLIHYLQQDAIHQPLLDAKEFARVVTWLDLYGQRLGSFSHEQEAQLAELRVKFAHLLEERGK